MGERKPPGCLHPFRVALLVFIAVALFVMAFVGGLSLPLADADAELSGAHYHERRQR